MQSRCPTSSSGGSKDCFDAVDTRGGLLLDRLMLPPPAGIMLLIYQRDNRPILITLRRSAIICHCQGDQECANQAPRLIQPNRKPIDYFSYLSHCAARETTGGNRANGKRGGGGGEGPDSKSHCLHLRWQVNAFERKYGFWSSGSQIENASVEKKVEIPGAAKQSATVQMWKWYALAIVKVHVCLQRWAFEISVICIQRWMHAWHRFVCFFSCDFVANMSQEVGEGGGVVFRVLMANNYMLYYIYFAGISLHIKNQFQRGGVWREWGIIQTFLKTNLD